MKRFALYYAPGPNSPLAQAAARWLGRDAHTGETLVQRPVYGIPATRLRQLTSAPRHYGFHGTLKPPFRLAPGRTAYELFDRLTEFARQQSPISLPPFTLEYIDKFFCLVPSQPVPLLSELAAQTVSFFDDLRASPSQAEIIRRKSAGLTPNQEKLLARWGYPYVMEEFRFHLTLTGAIIDPAEKELLSEVLNRMFGPFLGAPQQLAAITVFEEDAGLPMLAIASAHLRMPPARENVVPGSTTLRGRFPLATLLPPNQTKQLPL